MNIRAADYYPRACPLLFPGLGGGSRLLHLLIFGSKVKRDQAGFFILDRAGWALLCVFLRGLFLYNKGMTTEEKKDIASFIDLAYGWARGGYLTEERKYCFSDDYASSDSPKGAPDPLVMVVGEVSDSGEDALLLEKMLASIGLSKESNCFVTNVIEYEFRLQSMKPRFILCLGESSSQAMLHSGVEKLRGKLIDYKANGMTIPLVATYHPNDLLRNGNLKRPAWDDLKLFRAAIAPAVAPVTGEGK
jgi:hypothetical protein